MDLDKREARMLRTAERLEAQGHPYMPQGAGQRRTMDRLVSLGLMAYVGISIHYRTRRMGDAYRLNDTGRAAARE